MSNCGNIAPLILNVTDIYSFINNVSVLQSEEEKKKFIKPYTDAILSKTYNSQNYIKPSNNQYKELFKYSSMEDYLSIFDERHASIIIKELESLPKDYIFNIPFPFSELLNYNVLSLIGIYGLKNIVDFDNECGHFFTKNNFKMLKSTYDLYLRYSPNQLFTRKLYDENGKYIDNRPYTKEEFYEAMKRMIIYGPTNGKLANNSPDYREISGEFKARNRDLFISEEAPEELQKLFYTKSITPQFLSEHPEYITTYLNENNISLGFKRREIELENGKPINLYEFLNSKTDINGVINFIIEYRDILDFISKYSRSKIKFSIDDDINQISKKINNTLKKNYCGFQNRLS